MVHPGLTITRSFCICTCLHLLDSKGFAPFVCSVVFQCSFFSSTVFSDNNTLLLNIVVEKYYGKNRINYRTQKKIHWHKLHGWQATENKLNLFYVPQKKESGTHLERLEGKSFLDELSFKLCRKITDLSCLSISRNEQIVSVQSFSFWIDSEPINTK